MKPKYTPMMMQYLEIKEQYPDTIVMFRLGDFYEMFFDDAKLVSRELSLTLTGRDAGGEERVPMCGVPHHAVKGYLQRLIDLGHKVAIVEQLEDPATANGLVKRGIIQMVTPGTMMDNDDDQNRFIASLCLFDFQAALAFCDLSTGEMSVMSSDKNEAQDAILTRNVKELVVESDCDQNILTPLQDQYHILISVADDSHIPSHHRDLLKDIKDFKQVKAVALLLNYLEQTQRRELDYIQHVQEIELTQYLKMDAHDKAALELTQTIRAKEKYGSLLWLLDKARSAMGSRLLKQWIDQPLINIQDITARQDYISLFADHFMERESIREIMKDVYDLERLAARVAYGNVNARDILWIGKTLEVIPDLKYQLITMHDSLSDHLADQLPDFSSLTDLVHRAFVDTPPLSITEGGMFKKGYDETLDEYLDASQNGKQWILDFEAREKEKTGIKNLKVGYNKVFGYYIEVTRGSLDMVTPDMQYTRKQSLANAERFVTPELKDMETKILNAEDNIMKVEYELFLKIRETVRQEVPRLQDVSRIIATIDVYAALADLANQNGYVRPSFNHKGIIHIEKGRHPVIEEVMAHDRYVDNDLDMTEDDHLLLITGPNMGGKSTYMRQLALIVIMAQMGSFVPAKKANLPVFDRLFTRIGASDDLIGGQSTFMVEMLEANRALRQATKDSLIIFDEIGRGTATFDGMAIAQAMVEYIAQKIQCKALFSTHYHELTYLEETIPGIKNVHATVAEHHHEIIFQYKIKAGRANKSYGVNVARLAMLPEEILARAEAILNTLEDNNIETRLQEVETPEPQESEIEHYLALMDPLNMTPMEALSALLSLKNMIKEE